ncbi:hypothetical protein BDP27DRAFT_1364226 [Rhodocollybia butyracea]|uniref:Uncharacterized protein n=1 Tax=Rhodocollybia butyracea TaxID=206335 RepID=A0A9P5U7W5_9AGAR|nr:hypothetical protein BDP27DRAFT_1364226 [Rhodocollybia butyracea]
MFPVQFLQEIPLGPFILQPLPDLPLRVPLELRNELLLRPALFFLALLVILQLLDSQVGLGTARNFSTGRCVFQNLVENVPIAGRSLYEADWEAHMQSERDFRKKTLKRKATKNVRKASIHNSHEMHSLHVSALFSRLDAADVWVKGVQCSAYAERPDSQGVCTILKVEFAGWTKAEVRSVIGESGTGWCALEEITNRQEDDEDAFSDTSSLLSGLSGEDVMGSPFAVEPAQSLVLPTLDFSSSFVATSPQALSRTSSFHDIFPEAESDPWMESSGNWSDSNYIEFSSSFASRLQTQDLWNA